MSLPHVHLHWAVPLLRLFVVAEMAVVTLALATVPGRADTGSSYMDNFRKICDQPLSLIEFLRSARLAEDLSSGSRYVPNALREIGFEVVTQPVGKEIRIGAKRMPVEGHLFWAHFETSDQRPWVDFIEFESEEACKAVFDKRRQWHSGRTYPEYFSFITIKNDNGLDAVSIIVKRDHCLFNFGFAIPFKIKVLEEGNNEPEELNRH